MGGGPPPGEGAGLLRAGPRAGDGRGGAPQVREPAVRRVDRGGGGGARPGARAPRHQRDAAGHDGRGARNR